MGQSPRAVFFDMDDTLLDGVAAMEAAWPQVLAPIVTDSGVELEKLREAIRREGSHFWRDESAVAHWRLDLIGARAIVVERALASLGINGSDPREISLNYAALFRDHSQLFDDAIATLEAIRAAGLRTALLTNGPKDMQRDKIARFELAQYFDVVVIEGEFGRGKPESEVFRYALETVGVTPDRAWHVGDNLYADIGGAQSVGVHAAWIHRERLKMPEANAPAIPDRTVAHLNEITMALGLG